MELSQLSDYEKFILMTEKSRNNRIGTSLRAFIGFQDLLKALANLSKSDAAVFEWKETLMDKPITRNEAHKLLEDFDKAKWNSLFVTLARKLRIELR